jgi:phosphoglycolate phosphatase-like HAD superfamily hydrolase
MFGKRLLVVLDFDGLLVNSYALLRDAMASFGLDVGDEDRFRNRRKFLKYLGGGKELLHNLVGMSLPKTRRLRARLTECYREGGYVFPEFIDVVNHMIASPAIHCGIVSRNFTLRPGPTIRTVLARSGIDEAELDFVVPIPVGAKKVEVLEGMQASRYHEALLCADEIGDYHAACSAGYDSLMGSYGFDARERLLARGEVPSEKLYDSLAELATALRRRVDAYDAGAGRQLACQLLLAPQPTTALIALQAL